MKYNYRRGDVLHISKDGFNKTATVFKRERGYLWLFDTSGEIFILTPKFLDGCTVTLIEED